MNVPTAPAALQTLPHTQDDTDTAHGHALQMCSVRHELTGMCVQHCKRPKHIHCRPPSMSGGMRAATEVAQALVRSPPGAALGAQQLSMNISAARRLLSPPATRAHPAHSAQAVWACAARRHTCSSHALRPRRSERSRSPPCCTNPARPRSSFRAATRWLDGRSRAASNHVLAARSGRTAATALVQQHRSVTFRAKFTDPSHLGLDHACSHPLALSSLP